MTERKVAVVTGAAGGIGAGLARAAARAGMAVVIADISADRLGELEGELAAGEAGCLAVRTDVSHADALDALASATFDRFGRVDMLFANAGIEMLGYTWELSAAQWDQMIAVNIAGVIHTVRAFAEPMISAGRPAQIACVSSVGGLGIMPVQTPYILSKHAVLSFAECLYLEMERRAPHVSVSAVLPGPVATRIFTDAPAGRNPASTDHHRSVMNAMLEGTGMSGDDAGALIFAGVSAGEFWVTTHPELLRETAERRARHLAELARPALRADAAAILGD